MISDEWYYKELGIDSPYLSKSVITDQDVVTNLTNHKLYGKLCNWLDIVDIYMLKRQQFLSS